MAGGVTSYKIAQQEGFMVITEKRAGGPNDPAHISEILKTIIGEIIVKAKDNEQSDETES